MTKLNPIALKFLFEEDLYFFQTNSDGPKKNERKLFLGKNNKNISILSPIELTDDQLNLLGKILSALSLSFDDVAIITNQNSLEFLEITKPNKILLFGVSPFEIGFKDITLNAYESTEIDNIKILQAEKFDFYQTNIDKKKALWLSLQRFF